MVRLIPKSHHFGCDYPLVALCPKTESNERTELKQLTSFKFKNTKKNTKLNFFKTNSFLKSYFPQKIAEFKLYSSTVNIQINKQK